MKIAISVPDQVFGAGEHLAKQLGVSRSQLYSDALAAYLSHRGMDAVTARLNEVYAAQPSSVDPSFGRVQPQILANEAW